MIELSWNSGFNEAAAICGLTAEYLLAMPETSNRVIGDAHWSRSCSKIHVGIGNAFWTVDVAGIIPEPTKDARIAAFESCAKLAGMTFTNVQCCEDEPEGRSHG